MLSVDLRWPTTFLGPGFRKAWSPCTDATYSGPGLKSSCRWFDSASCAALRNKIKLLDNVRSSIRAVHTHRSVWAHEDVRITVGVDVGMVAVWALEEGLVVPFMVEGAGIIQNALNSIDGIGGGLGQLALALGRPWVGGGIVARCRADVLIVHAFHPVFPISIST